MRKREDDGLSSHPLSLFASTRGSHASLDWHVGILLLRLGRPVLPPGYSSQPDAPPVLSTLPARRVEFHLLPSPDAGDTRPAGGSNPCGLPVPRQGAAVDQPRR